MEFLSSFVERPVEWVKSRSYDADIDVYGVAEPGAYEKASKYPLQTLFQTVADSGIVETHTSEVLSAIANGLHALEPQSLGRTYLEEAAEEIVPLCYNQVARRESTTTLPPPVEEVGSELSCSLVALQHCLSAFVFEADPAVAHAILCGCLSSSQAPKGCAIKLSLAPYLAVSLRRHKKKRAHFLTAVIGLLLSQMRQREDWRENINCFLSFVETLSECAFESQADDAHSVGPLTLYATCARLLSNAAESAMNFDSQPPQLYDPKLLEVVTRLRVLLCRLSPIPCLVCWISEVNIVNPTQETALGDLDITPLIQARAFALCLLIELIEKPNSDCHSAFCRALSPEFWIQALLKCFIVLYSHASDELETANTEKPNRTNFQLALQLLHTAIGTNENQPTEEVCVAFDRFGTPDRQWLSMAVLAISQLALDGSSHRDSNFGQKIVAGLKRYIHHLDPSLKHKVILDVMAEIRGSPRCLRDPAYAFVAKIYRNELILNFNYFRPKRFLCSILEIIESESPDKILIDILSTLHEAILLHKLLSLRKVKGLEDETAALRKLREKLRLEIQVAQPVDKMGDASISSPPYCHQPKDKYVTRLEDGLEPHSIRNMLYKKSETFLGDAPKSDLSHKLTPGAHEFCQNGNLFDILFKAWKEQRADAPSVRKILNQGIKGPLLAVLEEEEEVPMGLFGVKKVTEDNLENIRQYKKVGDGQARKSLGIFTRQKNGRYGRSVLMNAWRTCCPAGEDEEDIDNLIKKQQEILANLENPKWSSLDLNMCALNAQIAVIAKNLGEKLTFPHNKYSGDKVLPFLWNDKVCHQLFGLQRAAPNASVNEYGRFYLRNLIRDAAPDLYFANHNDVRAFLEIIGIPYTKMYGFTYPDAPTYPGIQLDPLTLDANKAFVFFLLGTKSLQGGGNVMECIPAETGPVAAPAYVCECNDVSAGIFCWPYDAGLRRDPFRPKSIDDIAAETFNIKTTAHKVRADLVPVFLPVGIGCDLRQAWVSGVNQRFELLHY